MVYSSYYRNSVSDNANVNTPVGRIRLETNYFRLLSFVVVCDLLMDEK